MICKIGKTSQTLKQNRGLLSPNQFFIKFKVINYEIIFVLLTFIVFSIIPFLSSAQTNKANTSLHTPSGENLYIDVHKLEAGKVKYEDVAIKINQEQHAFKLLKIWNGQDSLYLRAV